MTREKYISRIFSILLLAIPPLQVTLTRIGAKHDCRASPRLPTHEPATSNILWWDFCQCRLHRENREIDSKELENDQYGRSSYRRRRRRHCHQKRLPWSAYCSYSVVLARPGHLDSKFRMPVGIIDWLVTTNFIMSPGPGRPGLLAARRIGPGLTSMLSESLARSELESSDRATGSGRGAGQLESTGTGNHQQVLRVSSLWIASVTVSRDGRWLHWVKFDRRTQAGTVARASVTQAELAQCSGTQLEVKLDSDSEEPAPSDWVTVPVPADSRLASESWWFAFRRLGVDSVWVTVSVRRSTWMNQCWLTRSLAVPQCRRRAAALATWTWLGVEYNRPSHLDSDHHHRVLPPWRWQFDRQRPGGPGSLAPWLGRSRAPPDGNRVTVTVTVTGVQV